MTQNKRGYFKHILAIDCETSGLQSGAFLTPYKANDGGYYQTVAWGMLVVDSITLKPIDSLYVEIKWDGLSKWNDKAEAVHGLSREYLEQHGMSEEDAVVEIANFIVKYWSGLSNISALGHNLVSFDLPFLHDMFDRHEIKISFSNRHYDTNTLALVFNEDFNSDDFFESMGLAKRDKHNALQDIQYTVEAARRTKNVFNLAIQG